MVPRADGDDGHPGSGRPCHGRRPAPAWRCTVCRICSGTEAACVAHVPEHDLGAAAYAIKAVQAAAPAGQEKVRGLAERDWQRRQIPAGLYGLVLEDQARRNDICWLVFSD